ncbi:hypothetical protein DY000_02045691 [Brassica cretica]|uniref:RNase H type-1 domain-containing protein n=1 Tax=Brassica cretica TaxID=69181 RepID=A0ABQ7F0Z7_BRACR|nr:hypothetical protein DY000_02045691 [Brassica cretica]
MLRNLSSLCLASAVLRRDQPKTATGYNQMRHGGRTMELQASAGSSKKNTEASFFCAHCHFVASPLVAEALALREAVFKCKELGIQRLRCETDSAHSLSMQSRKPNPDIYGIMFDIVSLISEFELIQFRWIPRGKNKDDDALAKQALSFETDVMNSTFRGF